MKTLTNNGEKRSFKNARKRCNNANDPDFYNYGGRGIQFQFDSFDEFFAEVGERPSRKHTLERINNNGNYAPGNVRWATMKEQSNNRRTNHLLYFEGVLLNIGQWAKRLGVDATLLYKRKSRGWCDSCTLSFAKIARGTEGGRWRQSCPADHR